MSIYKHPGCDGPDVFCTIWLLLILPCTWSGINSKYHSILGYSFPLWYDYVTVSISFMSFTPGLSIIVKQFSYRIFRLALLFYIIFSIYFLLIRSEMMHGGALEEENHRPLVGDDIVKLHGFQSTLTVSINVPAESVWPWIVQIGQDHAGFYSYNFLESSAFCGIQNSNRIIPAWQQRSVGDFVPVCQGIGGWKIANLEPNRSLVFKTEDNQWSMSLVLSPLENNKTRLISRMRYATNPRLMPWVADIFVVQPAHLLMQKGMLLGIQQRAEGLPIPSPVMEGIVWGGALMILFFSSMRILFYENWLAPMLTFFIAFTVMVLLLWLRLSPGVGFGIDVMLTGLLYLDIYKVTPKSKDQT
jgi:hypothetical protein